MDDELDKKRLPRGSIRRGLASYLGS